LAGRPPFGGGSDEEKLRRNLLEEPVRIDRLRPDVHPAVVALVHQLLAKHPRARPATAAEVVERLEGAFSAGAVTFDLPVAQVGAASFATGQLSGLTLPGGSCPGAPDASSQWEQITGSHRVGGAVEPARTGRKKASRFPLWGAASLGVVAMFGIAAAGMIFKMAAKW
jgi:hypothetical protein